MSYFSVGCFAGGEEGMTCRFEAVQIMFAPCRHHDRDAASSVSVTSTLDPALRRVVGD